MLQHIPTIAINPDSGIGWSSQLLSTIMLLSTPMPRASHNESIGEFSYNNSVLELYSSAFSLTNLLKLDSYKRFLAKYYGDAGLSESELGGFSFAVGNVLYRQLLAVIHEPSVLGLAENEAEDLLSTRMMWSREGIRNLPGDSVHCRIARTLVSAIRSMASCKNWKEIRTSGSSVVRFETALSNLCKHYVRVQHQGRLSPLSARGIRRYGVFFTHVYLNDIRNVEFAYHDLLPTTRSATLAQLREEIEEWDGGIWSHTERFAIPNELLPSFARAVSHNWHFWLGTTKFEKHIELFLSLGQCTDWTEYDGFFSKLEVVTGRTPKDIPLSLLAGKAKGIRVSKIPGPELDRLAKTIPPYRDRPRAKLSLAEIFEYRPLRLLTDGDSIQGAGFFITVFLGLLMHPSGDKVRILKLKHPKGKYNDISYAFFVPAFGSISNASEYWVLKDITDDSDHPDMTRVLTEQYITRHRKSVDLREYEVSDGELAKGLDDPVLRDLSSRVKRNGELIAALQGSLLECLAATHFAMAGFELKKLRRKLTCMNGMEIDVVAVRKDARKLEIILAQCKGRLRMPVSTINLSTREETIVRDPEMKKIVLFSQQLAKIKSDPSRLLRELHLRPTEGGARVQGIVVTTNLSRDEIKSFPQNLELWTSEEWGREFRRNGLPGSIFEPIERIIRNELPGRRILDYWET